jgi:hypothetical protein
MSNLGAEFLSGVLMTTQGLSEPPLAMRDTKSWASPAESAAIHRSDMGPPMMGISHGVSVGMGCDT